MDIEEILGIEEITALAYFIPDYKSNTDLSSIKSEIESAYLRPVSIESEDSYFITGGPIPVRNDEDESSLDSVIEELKELNIDVLRQIGLSEATIRYILRMKIKPSRIRINRQSKIILDDYSGMEIKLDDKTKALYFLYLRHQEGIAIKDLLDYQNEVLDLYQSISGRDDPEAMKLTIYNLCNPYQNNANISLSRIKKAFCEAMTQQIASRYYVDGERGGLRSISIDRALVTWETIR